MDLTQLSSQLKVKTDFDAGSMLGLRDINSITGIVDNSITSIQALIMKNVDPKDDDIDITNFDKVGISSQYDKEAFVFDLKKEYKFNLSSDITDHYVEDNIAIQDHIGLKPIILDVVGSISEVNLYETQERRLGTHKYQKGLSISERGAGTDEKNTNLFNEIDSYSSRMGSLTSFAPNIVNQARDIYDSAKNVYNTGKKTFNFIKDPTGESNVPKGSGFAYTEAYNESVIKASRQYKWVKWFRTQWEKRASFTIVTPYDVLTDMYIMELTASQPENTRYVTNLNIKFKQIRKAKVMTADKKVSQTMDIQQTKNLNVKDTVMKMDEDSFKAWYGSDTAQTGAGQGGTTLRNNIGGSVEGDNYTVSVSNNTAVASYNVPAETVGKKSFTTSQIDEMRKGYGM